MGGQLFHPEGETLLEGIFLKKNTMIHYDWKLDWANISIDEYIALQNLVVDNPDNLGQEDLIMQEIEILYNRDPYKMTIQEFKKCVDSLKFISQPVPKVKLKDTYNLNGNRYRLHKKIEEFKVAQYIDYERIMKDKKGVENYADFIALFLTPDTCDYGDGYSVDTAVRDIGKYLSIAEAMAIVEFFFHYSVLFTSISLWYSMRSAMKATKDRKTRKLLRKKTMQMIHLIVSGA